MNKKVIMVLGTSRSGLTLLDLMLGNTKRGFSCGEIRQIFVLDEYHKNFFGGSPTTINSEHEINYQKQYDEEKINKLKNKFDFDTDELNNILNYFEEIKI